MTQDRQFLLTEQRRALFDLLLREFGFDEIGAATIPVVARDGDLPLSFAQQRLWFLDQFESGSPLYVIPIVAELTGPLDVARLREALQALVARHEALRTIFPQEDGKPRQVVHNDLALALPVTDVSSFDPEAQGAEVRRLILEEAQRPFDLAAGPLVRALLIRRAATSHLLLLTMHHIISDGWSVGVLLRDLAAIYATLAGAARPTLPPLPVQYVDFAAWQRTRIQDARRDADLAYWQATLAGAPTLLELPADRPRPAERTYWGNRITRALPMAQVQSLRALAQTLGITHFALLLTAFAALLYRYTGQTSLLIGTPVANRSRQEIEDLVGFFVNTLVLRADVAPDDSFERLARRLQMRVADAQAHQALPFEQLVDELQPERDLSATPLFQVMFDMQQRPRPLSAADVTIRLLDPPHGIAKFDLTLKVTEEPDGALTVAAEYNTALFDADRMARLLDHYVTLLEGIVAAPDASITRLPLLTADERRVLDGLNVPATPYPADRCLHEAIAAQAERTPDAPAIVGKDGTLSYAELDRRADHLAGRLRARGIGPESRVGLCAHRSPEMVVALLGILKAGGAYVPLEPSDPPARLAYIMEDAAVSALAATRAALLDRLPEHALPIVCLDESVPDLAPVPEAESAPQNAAYIIYTSGSTGRPKGVMISHRSVMNYLTWVNCVLLPDPAARVPVVTRLSFDASLKQVVAPLLRGGAVWLLPADVTENPAALIRALAERPATVFNGVPTLWHAMLDAVEAGRAPAPTGHLRRILLGGEALSPDLVARTRHLLPDAALWNVYGPTELTANATAGLVRSAGEVTLGEPVANTRLYIVDHNLNRVPVGVPGELVVGGAGVARGYLRRPGLTAERFVPDPFSGEAGARLYRTGDRVRCRADGGLEFLGRLDEQVKVRGFRVEPGEIESVLAQHPAIREVVVAARDGHLVAYVVPQDEAPTAAALRDALAETLPDYMIPSAFVTLDALPLMATGKVDRRHLPEPTYDRLASSADFVAPRNPAEEALAVIWADVLNLERVGAHDNFFELGGDSILSIQVVSRAAQAGLRITPKDIFRHQTLARLAEIAEAAPAATAEQGPVTGPVPLTPIQRRFFELAPPHPHHWNQAALVTPDAPLDPRILEAAVAAIVEHHDALRLRFTCEAGGWRQSNAAPGPFTGFEHVDLGGLPREARRAALEARATEAQASLDPAHGPLLRVVHFDLGDVERLLVIVHHLAVDGVSWRILMDDLRATYDQLAAGEGVALPAKTTSFKRWADRLAAYAQTGAAQAEAAYWRDALPDVVPSLPRDVAGGENTVASTRRVTGALTTEETRELLREAPRAYGTRVDELLLAALAWALKSWVGAPDLLVDVEGHGREALFEDVDLSRTVGWFTAIYPVYFNLVGLTEPGEVIKAVKETLRNVPARGVGYGVLRYLKSDVTERLRSRPQAELVFNYLGQFAPGNFIGAPESAGPLLDPVAQRRHLIEISAVVDAEDEALHVTWRYSETVHHRETILRLSEAYLDALREFVAHCLSPDTGGYTPSDFPEADLSQDDLDDLLADFMDVGG